MAVLVADRVERPPTLFDFVEGPPAAPVREPVAVPARAPEVATAPASAPEVATASASAIDVAPEAAGGALHEHDCVGGGPTLDDMIVGAWEGLTAQAAVACPLCDGTLRPLYSGGGGADPVVAGRCDRCGTTLS